MGDIFKSIGGFVIGIGVFIAIVLLAVSFIKGGVWLSVKLLPWLSVVMWLVLAADVLIILPLMLFKRTKGFAAIGLLVSSYVYGLTLWLWGLLLTYVIWGLLAVFIGLFLFGFGVVPIAMFATAIEGEWSTTGELLFLACLTYGARLLAYYLLVKIEEIANNPEYSNAE